MYKFISTILVLVLVLSLTILAGCGGGAAKPGTGPTTGDNTTQTTPNAQTSNLATGSNPGPLRSDNWLLGVWEASVPKTDKALFAGKKIVLKISEVMLVSNEKVQGNPTGKYRYSGSLIWDSGSAERTLGFAKENELSGDNTFMWSYLSPGANQFMENISLRVYDSEWQFELDWGPQIAKPGSSVKSLGFYGSIQNLDTFEKDTFDPTHMITLKQTSSNAPLMITQKPSTPAASSSTRPSSPTPSSPPPTSQGTGDIWSDIPLYPGTQKADDTGFSMSVPGDPGFSQIEWRFYTSSEDYSKVVDFYKNQMRSNGWSKMMWVESDEMSWGLFGKDNETRTAAIYIVPTEEGAALNIQSAAK